MKIVRLVLVAACLIVPVACNSGSITHTDTSASVRPASPPASSESADSANLDGSHTFGSGH